MSREERPPDKAYFEERLALTSQGDIYSDVPLAYPSPAREVAEDESDGGARRFLSGPLDFGLGLLITPTCCMRSQGDAGGEYAHPVRTLVPVWPLTELADIIDSSKKGLMKKYDALINFMYIPENGQLGIPESVALLYMPITLHRDMIDGQRITQLTFQAAQQLQRKLVYFHSGVVAPRSDFTPPMD